MRMMRLRGFLLFASSSLIVFAHTVRADTVVVTADRMIDVIAGRVIEKPRTTVVDGRIAAVETGSGALPEDTRRVDLPGATEVIKFCATGGVMSRTDTVGGQQYDLAEMTALVNEGHMLGLRVAAHAHGAAGIKDAIRAGTDTIEHCSLADAEEFALAKSHGTYFSMDIYNDDYIIAEGEKNGLFKESLDKERAIGRKQRETFQAAVRPE
jgi:imidazolonepropionase-like amidohydrolase